MLAQLSFFSLPLVSLCFKSLFIDRHLLRFGLSMEEMKFVYSEDRSEITMWLLYAGILYFVIW